MATPKQEALEAISALPDSSAPQDIINVIYQIYRLRSGLAARRVAATDEQAPEAWQAWLDFCHASTPATDVASYQDLLEERYER